MDAQEWYESKVPGLGRRFRAAVASVIDSIVVNPRLFPVVHRTVRRAPLRRFPYMLMFVIEPDDRVTVIACFHGSRDPLHWQERV